MSSATSQQLPYKQPERLNALRNALQQRILVTDGAANVGRPGGNPVVLLAGEAASFSGELQVAVAPAGVVPSAEDRAAFVVLQEVVAAARSCYLEGLE